MLGNQSVGFQDGLRPEVHSSVVPLVEVGNEPKADGQRAATDIQQGVLRFKALAGENVELVLHQLIPHVPGTDQCFKAVLLAIARVNTAKDRIAKQREIGFPGFVLRLFQRA